MWPVPYTSVDVLLIIHKNKQDIVDVKAQLAGEFEMKDETRKSSRCPNPEP